MYSNDELRKAGYDDFRVFLREVWAYLGLPEPTRLQYDIAYWLQHGPKRSILSAFRGVGKSWMTVAFVLWLLLWNPQLKIMVVSASQNLADDFSRFCKTLVLGMPLLQGLAPRPDQRSSGIAFDVGPALPSKDPSVKSVGITGQLTGSRADIIIADDVEIPKNAFTHLLRERLAELVKEFDALLTPKEASRILFLGTPQTEESLYHRLAQRGYVMRLWPAEIPENHEKYHGRLAPYIMGLIERGVPPHTPVEPKRFDEVELMSRRASYGAAGYALQFMLDTSVSDADRYPLKLRDLIVHDCDAEMAHVRLVWGGSSDLVLNDLPAGGLEGDVFHRAAWKSEEMAQYSSTIMAIDPSGRGSDETSYAIVKLLHSTLYLLDVGGFTDGFGEETLKTLAGKALRWKVHRTIIERNYGGGMFDSLLRPYLAKVGYGAIDEEWNGWSSTQKELRILDTLEPIVQNHRLVVDRRVLTEDRKQQEDDPRYSFVQQFTRMARIKGALPNEDRLEAVSMACAYFTDRMSKDQEKAVQQHKDALFEDEMKRYLKHAMAPQPLSTKLSWKPKNRVAWRRH